MSELMKKKIGTIIDDELLAGAKQRAALERRTLSGLIEDALSGYLECAPGREDALRALAKFSSHGGLLDADDLEKILEEDILAP